MTGPFKSIMIRVLLGPLMGATYLFALYVLIHGHYSPGGGFQGGVLLAAAVILPILVYGPSKERPFCLPVLGPKGAITLASFGVIIFAGTGLIPLLSGHSLLDYDQLPLPFEPSMRDSMGILIIEIGVTFGVAGSSISIFHSLYGDDQDPEKPQ